MKLGTVPTKTKIPLGTRLFGFSSKTSFFAGLGALFGTFLVILLNYKGRRKKKEKKRTKVRIMQELSRVKEKEKKKEK